MRLRGYRFGFSDMKENVKLLDEKGQEVSLFSHASDSCS